MVRDNNEAVARIGDILQDYALDHPLYGRTWAIDNQKVAVYIKKYMLGNSNAELKIQAVANTNDGRAIWFALKNHYEGVGIFANDKIEAERIIDHLFYSGEKRPSM